MTISEQTLSEQTHKMLEIMLKNNNFRKEIISKQDLFISGLFHTMTIFKEEIQQSFLKEIMWSTNKGVYLAKLGNGMILYTKDFKGAIAFNLKIAGTIQKKLIEEKWIIEVDELHSYQKGKGKFLLNLILNVSNNIGVPVTLWTETKDNVEYFKKYDFVNLGKRGTNGEYLMYRKHKRYNHWHN